MNTLDNYYKHHTASYTMPERRKKAILRLLGKNFKGKVVLDIGCSGGFFGKELEKKGAKVTGIDISSEALKLAKKNISKALKIDLNSEKLPFPKKSFDIVIASEVVEHLFDPLRLLKEIKGILKDDGVLILTTPNFLYWGNRLKFLKGNFEYADSGILDRGHIHFYTFESLRSDLLEGGWKIESANHTFLGNGLIKALEKKFPAFFAYQFILKCKKNK